MGGDGPCLSRHWSLPDFCGYGAQTNRPPLGEQMTPGVKTILSYCKWEPLQVYVVSPDKAMISLASLLPLQPRRNFFKIQNNLFFYYYVFYFSSYQFFNHFVSLDKQVGLQWGG